MTTITSDLVSLFTPEKPALIVTHQFPDVDAIGSTLALYLQLKQRNIPVKIWSADYNLDDCLLNNETLDDLKTLHDANIFHYNFNSAASFINNNFSSIYNWWDSDKTQKARKNFCQKYAFLNKNKINDLIKVFNSNLIK